MGENGFLYTDKEELINYMDILVEKRNMCDSMGKKAYETVCKDFTLDVLGERLFNIVKSVTEDE